MTPLEEAQKQHDELIRKINEQKEQIDKLSTTLNALLKTLETTGEKPFPNGEPNLGVI